jgi:hypothetical protein
VGVPDVPPPPHSHSHSNPPSHSYPESHRVSSPPKHPQLISSHRIASHRISSHLISSHLISSHLISGELSAFVRELHAALTSWTAAAKRGIWLTLPATCHAYVPAALTAHFQYHHATPERLVLTRWLPGDGQSPLPK